VYFDVIACDMDCFAGIPLRQRFAFVAGNHGLETIARRREAITKWCL
jgi:hypothetical protein